MSESPGQVQPLQPGEAVRSVYAGGRGRASRSLMELPVAGCPSAGMTISGEAGQVAPGVLDISQSVLLPAIVLIDDFLLRWRYC